MSAAPTVSQRQGKTAKRSVYLQLPATPRVVSRLAMPTQGCESREKWGGFGSQSLSPPCTCQLAPAFSKDPK